MGYADELLHQPSTVLECRYAGKEALDILLVIERVWIHAPQAPGVSPDVNAPRPQILSEFGCTRRIESNDAGSVTRLHRRAYRDACLSQPFDAVSGQTTDAIKYKPLA